MKTKICKTTENANDADDEEPHLNLSFMDDVNDSVWMIDRNYCLIYANHAFQEIFRKFRNKNLAQGECVLDPGAPEKTNQPWKKFYDRILQIGETFTSEIQSTVYPGTRFFEFTFSPVFSKRKTINGVFVFGRDITEKKQVLHLLEQQNTTLKESERMQRTMISNLPGFVYRCANDHNWTMTYISDACKKITGYSPEDFLNNSKIAFNDIVHPDYRDNLWQKWQDLLSKKSVFREEYPIINANDEIRWVYEQGQGVFSETGELLFLEGFIEDITDRKSAEKELLVKERSIETAINAKAISDLNGKLTYVNPAFITLWGYENKAEIVGRNATEFWKYGSEAENVINKLISEGGWRGELTGLKLNGQYFIASVSASLVTDEKTGTPLAMLASFLDITKEKEAEKALKESEQKFNRAFNNTPDIIMITSLNDGKIIEVNDCITRIAGYRKKDVIGKTTPELNFWADMTDRNRYLQMMKNEGRVLNLESKFRKMSGEETPAMISGEIIEIQGEKCILSVIHDISDRKKAEAALRESERRFRDIIEKVNMISAFVDASANITFVNDYLLKLTGYTREELIGKNWFDVFIPPDSAVRHDLFSGFENGDVPVYYQNEILTRDGHRRLIDWSNSLLQDENGNPSGIAGLGVDITDKSLAEEKLKHYQSIVAASSDMMAIIDRNYTLLAVNKTYAEAFKLKPEQMTGLTVPEIIGKDVFENLLKPEVDKCLKGENRNLQTWLTFQDLPPKYMDIHYYPFINDKNEISGFVVNARDITENKKAQEALVNSENLLRELNLTKDKFFSIIAHDLKSPFNSIIGMSDLLKEEAETLDVKNIRHYATIINSAANQTLILLENLLNWARMQQGRMEFNPKNLLLHQLTSDVIDMLSETSADKNIRLQNNIPETTIVHADENMLTTTIRNLLGNAIKFTHNGGSVIISSEKTDDIVRISVTDTGIGISAENIEKLFNIGSSISTRGTRNEKGTGLGLILCKEFIEKHGGRIWAKSVEGQGSSFTFTLPLK